MTETPDEVIAATAAVHARRGYTISVYLPPQAPWEVVEATMDLIADHVHGLPREGWDGFVVGHTGDVLGIDGEPEFPLPVRPDGTHWYYSCGCLHEDLILPDGRTGHEYCEGETGACGTKVPATCKHCGAPCACPNHRVGNAAGVAGAATSEEQP